MWLVMAHASSSPEEIAPAVGTLKLASAYLEMSWGGALLVDANKPGEWINDTGAYLYGKQFGRHKFFERISPKKTWEGTMAGAILTLAFAFLFHHLAPTLPLVHWIALAIHVVLFGTHGDLAESLIKRSLNIKDSGSILPGHGGILDRFDTMLVSAPFVFLYLFFTNLI